jgi:hypothetical protein
MAGPLLWVRCSLSYAGLLGRTVLLEVAEVAELREETGV